MPSGPHTYFLRCAKDRGWSTPSSGLIEANEAAFDWLKIFEDGHETSRISRMDLKE